MKISIDTRPLVPRCLTHQVLIRWWLRSKINWASLVTQWWRICLPRQEMWVQSLVQEDPLETKWQPTPVFLPGKSHGQRSLASYSPWSRKRVGHDLVFKQQQCQRPGYCPFIDTRVWSYFSNSRKQQQQQQQKLLLAISTSSQAGSTPRNQFLLKPVPVRPPKIKWVPIRDEKAESRKRLKTAGAVCKGGSTHTCSITGPRREDIRLGEEEI